MDLGATSVRALLRLAALVIRKVRPESNRERPEARLRKFHPVIFRWPALKQPVPLGLYQSPHYVRFGYFAPGARLLCQRRETNHIVEGLQNVGVANHHDIVDES